MFFGGKLNLFRRIVFFVTCGALEFAVSFMPLWETVVFFYQFKQTSDIMFQAFRPSIVA